MNRRQKLFIAAVAVVEIILFAALISRLAQGHDPVRGCWWLALLIYIFFHIGRAFVCPPAYPQDLLEAFGHNVSTAFTGFGRRGARKKFLNALRPFYNDNYDKSLKRLNKVERRCKEPADHAAVNIFKAICYDRMFDSRSSAAHYQKALGYVHDVPRAHANLSVTQVELGQFDEALESIRIAINYIESDPTHTAASADSCYYGNLASLLLRLGRFEEALAPARRSYELDKTNPNALQALTIANYHLGNHEESRRYRSEGLASGLSESKLHHSAIVPAYSDNK